MKLFSDITIVFVFHGFRSIDGYIDLKAVISKVIVSVYVAVKRVFFCRPCSMEKYQLIRGVIFHQHAQNRTGLSHSFVLWFDTNMTLTLKLSYFDSSVSLRKQTRMFFR